MVAVRLARRLGQVWCGLRGHDEVLAYEGARVLMRCTSCGHDSPGWDTSGRGPRKRFEGDAKRHRIKPQIVRRRKSA